MECARHERVVVYGVGENDQLGAAHGVVVLGQLRGLLDDAAHQTDGVKVDAGLGGGDVYRGADQIGLRHGLRNGVDEDFVALGEALLHEGREAADEVYAGGVGRAVERLCERHIAVRARGRADHGDRGDGNTLVDDRDAELALDLLAGRDELFCTARYLVVDLVREHIDVVRREIAQRNAHRDGADVKVLLLDHLDGFQNIFRVDHRHNSVNLACPNRLKSCALRRRYPRAWCESSCRALRRPCRAGRSGC